MSIPGFGPIIASAMNLPVLVPSLLTRGLLYANALSYRSG
jgi:hypothetical protein